MAGNSSSSDGNSRSGKRAADQSFINNPKERKRGFGIAKLERMRVEEEEMKEKYLKDPFSRARISGAVQGAMAYGTGGHPSGQFDLPFARPPSTSEAATHVNPMQATQTLQLFPDHMENGHADSKKEEDHNPSGEPNCKNSDDPQDLDLDLKL